MKKTIIAIILLQAVSLSLLAQKPVLTNLADSLKYGYWTRNTQLGANFSGSAFSGNWQGGGNNNLVIGGTFANRADRFKGKGVWTNDLQIQIGSISNYIKGKPKDSRKNLDRIFAESKYAQKINPKLNWFIGATFLTQMINGYDFGGTNRTLTSGLLAPGFLTEGIGLEYKPNKFFVLSLGGATLRQTFVVKDDVKKSPFYAKADKIYGVEKAKSVRNEGGFQVVGAYDRNLTEKVNLKWRWQSFIPYNFGTVDHNVNAIATFKINKYVNLNATAIGIYDWDQTGGGRGLKPWQINGGFNFGFALQL